ncbi:MAG: iron-sulfur cluster assembly scaffold protein [Sphingomonadaceae bacterium]|nr:iron-sulfur cluster assembly scaffold protein [Sphingomonadaceae bacterium]
MTVGSTAKLYTPEVLALAVKLAHYPPDPSLPLTGEARSRSCGSSIIIYLAVDANQKIKHIGMQAAACAIGQASAAIFADHAPGMDFAELSDSLAATEAWLAGEGPMPVWPGLDLIAPAREHPARHGAILLPWKAALDALSKV